jgi:hypothetical protein
MAKLIGVKTLDMVNGDVTRVEYDGAVYERVEEEVATGDLIYITAESRDVTAHAFYKVIGKNGFDDYQFLDDEDDSMDVSYEEYALFRTKTPKVEPLNVGDYIVALPESDREYGITNTDMKLGKIIEVDDDEIEVETIAHKDSSEVGQTYAVEPKYFRKATEEELVGARWVKIGRKPNEFKKGDIVRVIRNNPYGAEVERGFVGEITSYDTNNSFNVGGNGWMCSSSVELITPVEARFDVVN